MEWAGPATWSRFCYAWHPHAWVLWNFCLYWETQKGIKETGILALRSLIWDLLFKFVYYKMGKHLLSPFLFFLSRFPLANIFWKNRVIELYLLYVSVAVSLVTRARDKKKIVIRQRLQHSIWNDVTGTVYLRRTSSCIFCMPMGTLAQAYLHMCLSLKFERLLLFLSRLSCI